MPDHCPACTAPAPPESLRPEWTRYGCGSVLYADETFEQSELCELTESEVNDDGQ